jgi:hypothetical protein
VYNNGLAEAIGAQGSNIPPYTILHLKIGNAKNVDIALLRLSPFRNLKSLSLGQIKWASLTPCSSVCEHYGNKHYNLIVQSETVDGAVDFIASAPCLENLIFWSVQCGVKYEFNST